MRTFEQGGRRLGAEGGDISKESSMDEETALDSALQA